MNVDYRKLEAAWTARFKGQGTFAERVAYLSSQQVRWPDLWSELHAVAEEIGVNVDAVLNA